jgi:DNA repair protein RecN (Recombination protein N)
MLTTLRIKNLALVADLTVEFQSGLTVITGETGAGKSILLGALQLALGERADRTLIRSGAESCSVEASFDVRKISATVEALLEENGLEPCEQHQLLVKRIFNVGGANRQFINGSPATLQVLGALGDLLVDIHGPHEHQSLLRTSRQLDILDAFGGLEPVRDAFAELVRRQAALEAEKTALIVDEQTYAQQLDLLRFQVREIAEAAIEPDEESRVEGEFRRASNAARLLELSRTATSLISEEEESLSSRVGTLGRLLQELERVDPGAASLVQLQEQLAASMRELQSELSRYADRVEVDPGRLAQLEARLNLLHSLRRKYGSSLAEVIAFGNEARARLQSLEQRDEELNRLNAAIAKLDTELWHTGEELSARRRKLIPQLSRAVERELSVLGFQGGRFGIAITTATRAESRPASFSCAGLDSIEFQFAPNPGEPARPLRAIASSGEMARVMLALKTVLATADAVPVLVFDEVDANVGGDTGVAVGQKMEEISKQHQVLCITHLASVAARADAHYVVSKQLKAGRTLTEIKLLENRDRVSELARMLGGQSEASRKHAETMLKCV